MIGGWWPWSARHVPQNIDVHDNLRLFLTRVEELHIGPPEALVGPEGLVVFDWDDGARCVLSVSVQEDGTIRWASIVGNYSSFGRFVLPEWPDSFVQACGQVLAFRKARERTST